MFRVGTKEAKERTKAEMRDLIIKAKVRAEGFGFREGFQVAEKLTRKELQAAFKDSREDVRKTQKALIEMINEQLPPDLRGNFLNPIIQNLTKRKQESILRRIIQLEEKRTKQELVKELEGLINYPESISLDYKRRLDAVLGDINTKKITTGTRAKLEGLKKFADQQGMPSGVSNKMLVALKRMQGKQASELTNDELRELVEMGKKLTAMGQLKAQLKMRYSEREKAKAMTKLLASTNDVDFEVKGEPGKADALKAGALSIYMDTLTSPRVAEMIDGYQIGGENRRLADNLAKKETDAQWKVKTLLEAAVNEMLDLGIETLTDEQNVKIMINIREQEGAPEAVNQLMVHYGIKEFPQLTNQEQGIINIMRRIINENTDQLAAIVEELTNQPFVKLETYILPLKYEKEAPINPTEAILHDRYRTTQTVQGFKIQRKQQVKKLPRVDLFGVFEQALNEQHWYMNMQPEITNIAHLVKTKEYHDKAGDAATNWWKDHLDIVSRRGWSAQAKHGAFQQGLRVARQNLAQAILGYKLSSIMMQPFAVIDAMAYVQGRWGSVAALQILGEVTKAWVIPGRAQQFIDESPKLQLRTGGEVAIAETLAKIGRSERSVDKFVRGGLALLQRADVITAAGVQQGIQKILEGHGIPDAAVEAGLLMDLTNSSSDIAFRPHVLAWGEGARAWFTFQTFMLNRWGIVMHDLINRGLRKTPGFKAKFNALLGLMIIVAGKIAEDESREFMFETMTGRELPDRSMLSTALFALPSNIPFFGNMIDMTSGRGGSDLPIIRVMQNIFGVKRIFTAKTLSSKQRAALRALEASLTVTLGIPGTAQAFDIIERILIGQDRGRKVRGRKK